MKQDFIKIITILILSIIMMPLLQEIFKSEVIATEFDTKPYENVTQDRTEGTDALNTIGRSIIGLLRGVGTIVSVVALIVMGIRYISISVEERAQYKKAMLPYVIGALMVFGITNLLAIIASVAGAIK